MGYRRYYGKREQLFEVTVPTHPEGPLHLYDGHAAFVATAGAGGIDES